MFSQSITWLLFRRTIILQFTDEIQNTSTSTQLTKEDISSAEDSDANETDVAEPDNDSDEYYTDSEPESPFEDHPTCTVSETAAAFLSYYQFLATMYLDTSLIEAPPSDTGWPDMKSHLRGLPKDDEVIDLLCHLPYLKPIRQHHEQWIMAHGTFTNYKDFALGHSKYTTEERLAWWHTSECQYLDYGPSGEIHIPSYMIGMVDGEEYCPSILLDVKHGVFYWVDPEIYNRGNKDEHPPLNPPPYSFGDPEEYFGAEPRWLHSAEIWSIPDFFEMLKNQFRELRFIPLGFDEVEGIYRNSETILGGDVAAHKKEIQAIYRKYGWPDIERYDKERCMVEVRAYTRKHAHMPDRLPLSPT